MALFAEYPLLTEKQIEELKRKIESEHLAANVEFLEQTNFSCKYRGTVSDQVVVFSYDKATGYVIEETD